MFDINNLNLDHFKVLIDNETIDINPPKVKALKKIMSLTSVNDETAIDGLVSAVHMIINSNKQDKKVSIEFIEDNFDIGMLNAFMNEYFKWVKNINSNPN
jgi:hypothetical protein